MIAYCVKKSNLQFSHVIGDSLVVKYLVIIPTNVKIENSSWKTLPVQKEGFQEIAHPKDRQDGSLLGPAV